jgi:hypothetical protein
MPGRPRRTTTLLDMPQPVRPRLAPLFDLICIVSFVVIGGRNHGELSKGIAWFFGVLWPFLVGWFGVALLAKLYRRLEGLWRALAVTWIGGVAVAQVLRGAFTDRPWISTFTIVALVYLGLTTFGWRLVATLVARRRHLSRS